MTKFFNKKLKCLLSSLIVISSYFISNGSLSHTLKVVIVLLAIESILSMIEKNQKMHYVIQIIDEEKIYYYSEEKMKPELTENFQEATIFSTKKNAMNKAYELNEMLKNKEILLITVKFHEKK